MNSLITVSVWFKNHSLSIWPSSFFGAVLCIFLQSHGSPTKNPTIEDLFQKRKQGPVKHLQVVAEIHNESSGASGVSPASTPVSTNENPTQLWLMHHLRTLCFRKCTYVSTKEMNYSILVDVFLDKMIWLELKTNNRLKFIEELFACSWTSIPKSERFNQRFLHNSKIM